MIIEHLCWYTCTSEEKVGGGQRVAAAYSEETLMSDIYSRQVYLLL